MDKGERIFFGDQLLILKVSLLTNLFLIAILAMAVITDFRWHKIPNWLTFPAMLGGIIINVIPYGFHGLFFSALGLAVGTVLFLIPYSIGGMGAGDVKLMGAIGSFLGAKNVVWACLFSCIFGGLYAIIFLVWKGSAKSYVTRYWLMLKTLLFTGKLFYIPPSPGEKSQKISYGVAIALGTLFFILGKNFNLRGYLP
jgi:prepilin peptidase CpaA